VCTSWPRNECYDNLSLSLGGAGLFGGVSMERSWRALKAIQFLQQYCPPQRLGF
jgi:hypothetical protein